MQGYMNSNINIHTHIIVMTNIIIIALLRL